MKRRLCFFLLAAAWLAVVLGAADRASAAIRVTIRDSTSVKVFYSSSSSAAAFLADLGSYDLLLHSTLTNHPGAESGAVLSTTLSVSDASLGTGTLDTLWVSTELIQNVSGLGSGQVFGTDLDAVNASGLLLFTQPSSAFLSVSSDVSATGGGAGATGTIQNNTSVNGSVVGSLPLPVGSSADALQVGEVANPGGTFSLSTEIVLSGANVGITGLAISASSTVTTMTPEPAPLLAWGLGALGLAVAATAQRRRLLRLA